MKNALVGALLLAAGVAAGEERVNLFANPEFDDGVSGWGLDAGVVRQETMPMSGVWVVQAVGGLYHFMTGAPTEWAADEDYTLAIRARSLGSGSALRIVQMGVGADGKVHEGTYATMLTAVGPEFHEYWIPFRTSATLKPFNIAFYKVDSKEPDTGLQIDSIKMFKGTITPFEVRKIGRPGRQMPVAGTEIPPKPNRYGRLARPLTAFVAAEHLSKLRTAVDLFAGTGAVFDQVLLQGEKEDVYQTDSDPDEVIRRLREGKYDVYVMSDALRAKAGPQLEAMLTTNLMNGAKLYAKPVWLPDAPEREGLDDFPRTALMLADSLAALVELTGGADAGAAVETQTAERVYGGRRHVVVRGLDANGATVSWRHSSEPLAGPRLGAYEDEGAKLKLAIDGWEPGLVVRWRFADFSGRVLAQGAFDAAAANDFEVPLAKLYTNMGLVKLELLKSDAVLDRRTEATYARTNDLARVYDDYTPSMWPMSSEMIDTPEMFEQLADLGMRASQMPTAGINYWPLSLRSGLAVGSNSIGGPYFWLPGKLKTRTRVPNVNTAEARRGMDALARRHGRAFRKYGPVQAYIQDEAELQRYFAADEVDAHPENVAAYRVRMAEKYGTIEEYNRRHKTSHASFDEVGEALLADARATGNFSEFVEWRAFNVDRWCEAIRVMCDGARAECPDVRVSCLNTFGPHALSGNDYYKLLTKTGAGYSSEYMSMVYFGKNPKLTFDEVYRSFRPDMRVWGYTGYFYTTDRARILPWWTACHRYGGFTWFAATSWGYNLIDLPGYALTRDGADLAQSLRDSKMLDGLGKVLTCWEWAPRDVAILYSHASMVVSTCLGKEDGANQVLAGSPYSDHLHSRLGAQHLVESLLVQHDYVAPEQVEKGALGKYRLLLMPRVVAMSDAEVAAVKAFVRAGGKVVADALPGDYDELGVKRAANPFAPGEIEVTGANFAADDAAQRAAMLARFEQAKVRKVLSSPTVVDHLGREAMHYVSGAADVYCVIRMPDWAKDADEETFVFEKPGYVYDVRAGRSLGRGDRVTAKVPNADGVCFAVLPSRVEGIDVAAPADVVRGGDLVADFAVRTSEGAAAAETPAYVLHVEVVPPSGKVRFHFKRNLMTQGGRAHLVFPLAFNDEPGEWKLRVTEPLTGVTAERTLFVR